MNTILINLGNLIRYSRKDKHFSTQELADKLKVSAGLINNIENAKNDSFNLELLLNLSSILNINILSFLLMQTTTSNFNINISNNIEITDKYIKFLSSLNNLLFSRKTDISNVLTLIDKLQIELQYFNSLNNNK